MLIDVSASMTGPFGPGTRLDGAKQALETIVASSSSAHTHLGLVSFNTKARLHERPGPNMTGVLVQGRTLLTEGGTEYCPAVRLGIEHGARRLILLSDGEPFDRHEAFALASECGEQRIPIDCVGIGEANPATLEEIARRSGGMYSRAESVAQLCQTFQRLETRNRALLEYKK